MARGYTVEQDNRTYANADGDGIFFNGEHTAQPMPTVTVVVLDVTSELGDAQEEHLRVQLQAGEISGTAGGSGTTARPHDPFDAASTTFWSVGLTGLTWVSSVNWLSDGFNVRIGYRRAFPALKGVESAVALRLVAGPTDDIAVNGTLSYVESPYP